jgi:hypothetical protein
MTVYNVFYVSWDVPNSNFFFPVNTAVSRLFTILFISSRLLYKNNFQCQTLKHCSNASCSCESPCSGFTRPRPSQMILHDEWIHMSCKSCHLKGFTPSSHKSDRYPLIPSLGETRVWSTLFSCYYSWRWLSTGCVVRSLRHVVVQWN